MAIAGMESAVMEWCARALAHLTSGSTDSITEIGGSVCAAVGSWLVASKKASLSKYGWLIWLCANSFFVVFAIVLARPVMLIMYLNFFGSSALGLWNHVVVPDYPGLARRFSLTSGGQRG